MLLWLAMVGWPRHAPRKTNIKPLLLEAFIRSMFVEQSRSNARSNNALTTDARISQQRWSRVGHFAVASESRLGHPFSPAWALSKKLTWWCSVGMHDAGFQINPSVLCMA
jgi:hypothetical protein